VLININARSLSLDKKPTPKMIADVRMPEDFFDAIRSEILEGEHRFYSGQAEVVNLTRRGKPTQTSKPKKTAPFKKKPKRHSPGERGERL